MSRLWILACTHAMGLALLVSCLNGPAPTGGISDGGPSPTDAGTDTGVPPDGGVVLTSSVPQNDPTCACGGLGEELTGTSRISVVCYCFSIPQEAFSCLRDSDCVMFHNTCGNCGEEPDIAVRLDWLGCLEQYRTLFCAGRRFMAHGYGSCCSRCPNDAPYDCPQVRCQQGLCSASVTNNCAVFRDPDFPAHLYMSPYPYTSPTIPGATCAPQ